MAKKKHQSVASATQTENKYEGMFLLPASAAAEVDASVKLVTGIIERHGGKILVIKKWDERKLMYEIKKQKRGLYVIAYFTAPGNAIGPMERDVLLSEEVLRVLVTDAEHLNQEEMEKVEPQPIQPRKERSWDRPPMGMGEDFGGGGRRRANVPSAPNPPAPARNKLKSRIGSFRDEISDLRLEASWPTTTKSSSWETSRAIPQLKYLPSQMPICEFGLAVNHKFKTKTGEERDEVLFIDCSCFGRGGEIINQYCTKGKQILVEGRLKYDTWEDKQGGGKRSKHTVVVDNFQFLGGARDAAGGGGAPQSYDQGGGDEYQQRPPQQRAHNAPLPRSAPRRNNPRPSNPLPSNRSARNSSLRKMIFRF